MTDSHCTLLLFNFVVIALCCVNVELVANDLCSDNVVNILFDLFSSASSVNLSLLKYIVLVNNWPISKLHAHAEYKI